MYVVASGAEHPATDSLVITHWRLDNHEKQYTSIHTYMYILYMSIIRPIVI